MGRWTGLAVKGVLALVVLAGLGVGVLYAATEPDMRVPDTPLAGALGAGDLREGARLAQVLGCRGCHQDDLGGGVFLHEPYVFRLVASNLTAVRDRYDDAAWFRLFRTGAKADGTLAVGMPNAAHQRLTDAEIADIVAYVRSVPAVPTRTTGASQLYPLARLGLVTGRFRVEDLAGDAPESAAVLAQRNSTDRGEHLAYIACSGCHGRTLEGGREGPSLVVAKAYDADKFARLLRTGITAAGRESATGKMTMVSRRHFSSLTEGEVAALHAYLQRWQPSVP